MGFMELKVFYVPKSDENIIKSVYTEVPFSYMFESTASECEVIDSEIVIKSSSAQINDYGEITAKGCICKCCCYGRF